MTHEARYCAFVDILGFVEITNALQVGAMKYEAVRDLLNIVHADQFRSDLPMQGESDLKAQSISDALFMSARYNRSGLLHMFLNIENLAMDLLKKGFFIRGGIVKGDVYHDERMAFGPGLVRAFRLEHEIARYPRIVMTREVANDASNYFHDELLLGAFVQQYDDGPFSLHVLNNMQTFIHYQTDRRQVVAFCDPIAQQIQRCFDEASDNPRHFEKVKWFARYWNETIGRFGTELKTVKGPGLNTFD